MNRILVPVDGSPRSLIAVEQVKHTFSPKAFEIVLLMVYENVGIISDKEEENKIREEMDQKLQMIGNNLERYSVIRKTQIGKAGQRIVECAREMTVSMIVITKSTKLDHSDTIGMTASYVIRHATCNVLVVQEYNRRPKMTYRGLVYRNAENTVNLRGQLSMKQSECLLPSVSENAIYSIQVTRGRVRFLHRSFNPDTKEWDLPPVNGQQEVYDIEAGETIDIPVSAQPSDQVTDWIRVVNRNMKTEAVFHYQIRPDRSHSGEPDETDNIDNTESI
jgi:nucleotide-binding universal stress UspA family protein